MKKYIHYVIVAALLIIFSTFSINLQSQTSSCCNNADFEFGNFTNWTGYTGINNGNGSITITGTGIVSGRHTIVSGPSWDANTSGAGGVHINVVAPDCGLYSCRLGNSTGNNEAEILDYQMTVSPNNSLFYYWYALVLKDSGLVSALQPGFEISILDSLGQTQIGGTCEQYSVLASASDPQFYTSTTGYLCKNWSIGALDMLSYIGQTVTVRFTTKDAAIGGSSGYAYISLGCCPFYINQAYCQGQTSAVLCAPPGFTYSWTGGNITTPLTTQYITIPNPVAGTVYSCVLTAVTGCTSILTTTITSTSVTANFSYVSSGDTVTFQNLSSATGAGTINQWLWNFGDGTYSTLQNPVHIYTHSNTYTVTLTSTTDNGCSGSNSHTVIVQTDINNENYSDFSTDIYPNPFDKFINIDYSLFKKSKVKVEVLDMLGRNVETIVNTTQNEGKYNYKFNATQVKSSSNQYQIKFTVNGKIYIKKVVGIK